MAAINDPFAFSGLTAKAKILLLGPSDFPLEKLPDQVRSLKNLEHVSLAGLMRQEISRRHGGNTVDQTFAALRRWFFARKPDAGFVLQGFPATLLQAKVFDEWLDARDETLQAVLASPGSDESVVEHYSTLGLVQQTGAFHA